jgi:hypothetical protein
MHVINIDKFSDASETHAKCGLNCLRRLLEPIGDVPPAEFDQAYYEQLEGQAKAA